MIRLDLMRSALKHMAVLALVLIVLAVFLAPTIDLEPTALRASRAAQALQAALASAALVFTALLFCAEVCLRQVSDARFDFNCDLLVLNCTRLC